MNIRVLSCAEQEFAETVDYYNEQCPGLGYDSQRRLRTLLNALNPFPKHGRSYPPAQDDVLPIDSLMGFCIKPGKTLSLLLQ